MESPLSMPESVPASPTSPKAWWCWINRLALDAVAVAVAWLYVFGGMTGARVQPAEAVCLGTAVWLIYMLDRLGDAGTKGGDADRHQFAGRNARWLWLVIIAAAVAITWWALHSIRWVTLRAALYVGGTAGIYFMILLASRWKVVSQVLLVGVSGLFVLGLVQGETVASPGVQLWRAVVAGTIATVLYVGLRYQYDPPPWILTKKWLGGYIFALGVAVGPFSHLEDWQGLLHGTPVMLFASACALNSLGIRLWEHENTTDPELLMLGRLYPWLLAAIAGGALMQAGAADEWTRPVLLAVAGCVAGFGFLHAGRHWPAAARALAADGLMIAAALLAQWMA